MVSCGIWQMMINQESDFPSQSDFSEFSVPPSKVSILLPHPKPCPPKTPHLYFLIASFLPHMLSEFRCLKTKSFNLKDGMNHKFLHCHLELKRKKHRQLYCYLPKTF